MIRRPPGLAVLIVCLLASACPGGIRIADGDSDPPADREFSSPTVGIATWNVRRYFDTRCDSERCGGGAYEEQPSQREFELRADEIAAVATRLGAGVIVLQEIESDACLGAIADRLTGLYPHRTLGETGAAASLDVAVLSAFPLTGVVRHADAPIHRPDGSETSFAREFLEVRLDAGGTPLVVFAAHFKSKSDDDPGRRLAEAQAAREIVLAAAAAVPDGIVVLAGDLNDTPGSPPLRALEEGNGLMRVAADIGGLAATYLYNGTPEAIDHILLAPGGVGGYRPGSARVVSDGGLRLDGSDHAALAADFELPPAVR